MTARRTPQSIINRALDERERFQSDIQHRTYVRPQGTKGLHVVKNRAQGQEYVVGGPQRSFAPGTSVPAARNLHDQNETIIGEPPPGRRGDPAVLPIEQVGPQRPTIDGAFGEDWSFTSTTQVARFTSTITGFNFAPENFIETFDYIDGNSFQPVDYYAFEIVGASFISENEWQVQLYAPSSESVMWRFRVWAAFGSTVFADGREWLDPGDETEGRWKALGL